MSSSYFAKVSTSKEHEELLQTLAQTRPRLDGFDQRLARYEFAVEQCEKMELKLVLKRGRPLRGQHNLTLNFHLQGAQYFAKVALSELAAGVYRTKIGDIYKLQRRANFRVRVPESVELGIEITKVGESKLRRYFRLADISAGGAAVLLSHVDATLLPPQQSFEGVLYCPGNKRLPVQGGIRYCRKMKGYPGFEFVAGVQFVGMATSVEADLLAVIMEIYRCLFSEARR